MQLLALQINAEKYFFNIRKSLVEFDEVLEVINVAVSDHPYRSLIGCVLLFFVTFCECICFKFLLIC